MATVTTVFRRRKLPGAGLQKVFLDLRRWPTLSVIILTALFIVGIFGPPIKAGGLEYPGFAPYGYAEGTPKDRTIPPFWGREQVKMKTVVQRVNQLRQEATYQVSLRDARKIKPDAQLGEQVPVVSGSLVLSPTPWAPTKWVGISPAVWSTRPG